MCLSLKSVVMFEIRAYLVLKIVFVSEIYRSKCETPKNGFNLKLGEKMTNYKFSTKAPFHNCVLIFCSRPIVTAYKDVCPQTSVKFPLINEIPCSGCSSGNAAQ